MNSIKTTILLLSWRDIKSPGMGGAEIFTHEMMRNADLSKYNFVHFSPMFDGAEEREEIDDILYIRCGNLRSVIFMARKYYKENENQIDFVVDQCNTFRFFTRFWVQADKRIFFIHQLTREIWDIQSKFPINKIGKIMETPMLRLNKNDLTITVSESTKQDLLDVGFDETKVTVLPEGIEFTPWDESEFFEKEPVPTFIYIGRFAKYKGIDTCFETFGKIKRTHENARLWVVGKKDELYISQSLLPICAKYGLTHSNTNEECDVTFHGFVTNEKKLELMSRAHLLFMPSIREGWGLIVTEAAAVGTPSIVFDSPGLRDAVDFGRAGYMVDCNDSDGLASVALSALQSSENYDNMRNAAYNFSKQFSWKATGNAFNEFIKNRRLQKVN
ncbi:MAG: glycosyltransferase family 4 protein [Oscillospiraceae bacterium]|nr:glycosyltransferase family 4 protein [Oscillospiraceae bacterium]MCL2279536.1 glycosyltransferase family 4 protein [Oscillospiraceae bacterium]